MATTLFDVASARARFSSLKDGGFVFLDAPGGSQVPDEVGEAIARTLREASANNGAPYATSKRVGAIYDQARVDAVHYAAHEPIDVESLGCDVFLCSPYKYCGPHLGVAYGRHELLESWRPYKARPAPTEPVGHRFETGTPAYELLAGFSATIAYL